MTLKKSLYYWFKMHKNKQLRVMVLTKNLLLYLQSVQYPYNVKRVEYGCMIPYLSMVMQTKMADCAKDELKSQIYHHRI